MHFWSNYLLYSVKCEAAGCSCLQIHSSERRVELYVSRIQYRWEGPGIKNHNHIHIELYEFEFHVDGTLQSANMMLLLRSRTSARISYLSDCNGTVLGVSDVFALLTALPLEVLLGTSRDCCWLTACCCCSDLHLPGLQNGDQLLPCREIPLTYAPDKCIEPGECSIRLLNLITKSAISIPSMQSLSSNQSKNCFYMHNYQHAHNQSFQYSKQLQLSTLSRKNNNDISIYRTGLWNSRINREICRGAKKQSRE